MGNTHKDIGKSRTGFANMPTEVVHSEYPKQEGLSYEIDDTITGIDEQAKHAKGKIVKHPSHQK